mmetsp:Transcript_94219/g.304936  ORF Transcript_94219/g.304936 Transcript_94219/m.304936 type:complete len:569 (+) Transcript_94219:566-2272(+)
MVLRHGRLLLLHERVELCIRLHKRCGASAVVLAEHLQGLAHAAEAEFEVGLSDLVVRVRLHADLVHLGGTLSELAELIFQLKNLRLQLGGLRGGLVYLGGQLSNVVVEFCLLRLGLGHLLIAVRLLVGLLGHLLFQLRNHVRDERPDLSERVLAAELDNHSDAGGELGESGGVVGFGELLDDGDDLGLAEVSAALHLDEGIALGHGAGARLLEDIHGRGQRLQLLAAGGHGLLVVGSDLQAGAPARLHRLLRVRELLPRNLEVARGAGLGLLRRGLAGLLLIHVLVVGGELILQGLLEHLEVVRVGVLGLAEVAELTLGLLLQVLQDLQDAAALALVRRGGRRAELGVLVLGALLGLHEGDELLLVRAREGRGVEHRAQGLEHGLHAALAVDLSQSRRVFRHLLREDAGGAVEGIDGVHELGLGTLELGRLLAPDLRGVRQLRLGGGDGAGEVRNLVGGHRGVAGQLVNLGLRFGHLLGRRLDGVLAVLRRVVAPLEILLVGLGLGLALLDDLALQLAQELQDLANWVHLLPRDGGAGGAEEGGGDGLHCSGWQSLSLGFDVRGTQEA